MFVIPLEWRFVNWVFKEFGVSPANSAEGFAWQIWGEKIDTPELGALTIVLRGDSTDPDVRGPRHIGFYVDETSDGKVLVLGGNDHNQVSISAVSKDKIVGYRMPAE